MLEGVDRIQARIQQIESRLQGPPPDSAYFRHLMSQQSASQAPVSKDAAALKMNQLSGMNPQLWGAPSSSPLNLSPLAQNNSISCGQTSVAMAINSLTGQNLRDYDIDAKYGFQLMTALNSECNAYGVRWNDAGNLNASSWDLIDQKVNVEKTPVIVALNGPEFSPSGRGHIVTIIKTEGDTVTYADPADGTVKTTSKSAMNNAPSHPDGNFVFYATRETPPPSVFPNV
ncbi:MAG: C39 family peptidase [Candidatus Eremiobacterota bacterium]